MTIYVHKITTAIIFGYFDAILKECIGNRLNFQVDNGRRIIFFRYVDKWMDKWLIPDHLNPPPKFS